MANLVNLVIRRTISSGVGGINHVTVVGAGLMGSGIAQVKIATESCGYKVQSRIFYLSCSKVAAQSGHRVTLVELDSSLIDKAKKSIAKNLERVAKKQFKDDASASSAFVNESLARISGSTDIIATAKDTDLVIEAIVERLEVKQKLFSSIDEVSMIMSSMNEFDILFVYLLIKKSSGCKANNNFCKQHLVNSN